MNDFPFGGSKNDSEDKPEIIPSEELNGEDLQQEEIKRVENEEKEIKEYPSFNLSRDEKGYENELIITNEEKSKGKETGMLKKLVLVSVLSSILGGVIVALLFQFGVPILRTYFPNDIWGDSYNNNFQGILGNNGGLQPKNIVISANQSSLVPIAEKVGPSVVGIKVTLPVVRSWPFDLGTQSSPEGSGIIIREDGYIMTNNHVIEEAVSDRTNNLLRGSKIEVILPNQEDKPYEAELVGRDIRTDLAVLRINAKSLPSIEFGNSDVVKVGDLAVAVGNPGGLEYMGSVTSGIISGLNRTVPIEDGKELRLIQTDAAINPGNSGGALVNAKGQLIGINTAKIGGSGFEGLGFAIPVNKAKDITDSLIEFKYVKGRPLLGITADYRYDEDLAKEYGLPIGVLVSDVTPFSGAYKAGIKRNDIITKFDGESVKTVDDINELKDKRKPGEIIKVEVFRDDKKLILDVTLTEDKR